MIELNSLIEKAILKGYDPDMAIHKVCQDVILSLLESSKVKKFVNLKFEFIKKKLVKY